MNTKYKTQAELKAEAKHECAAMTIKELRKQWSNRFAFQTWYVDVLERELQNRAEKGSK